MACCMELVGLVTVSILGLKVAYNVLHFAYTTFFGRLLGHGIELRKCGPWAVVTGATDGIGKAYAHALAKAGLNVVLISRTQTKLEAVANEIKNKSSVQVKTIAADFTDGQSIYPKIRSQLDGLEVGILVNNVGMAVGFAQLYSDIKDEKEVHDIINCNVMSMVRMSHMILPQMVQRKRGAIINIGSLAGTIPTPMSTIYGATKAFVDKFSQDLAAEARPQGVTVQTVHPGFVVSNMSKLKKATLTAPDPDTYVAAALSCLGLEDRTAGFWFHKIQLYFFGLLSFFLRGIVEQQTMKYMVAYRQKIIKRELAAAKAQ